MEDEDARSWHCGCELDPYPDDPFQGRDPPDPDTEAHALFKKEEGAKKHACKKIKATTNAKPKPKVKTTDKAPRKKQKSAKPSYDPDDLLPLEENKE